MNVVPGLADQVRQDRGLLMPVTEESLRFFSSFTQAFRATTEQVEIPGQGIGRDQMVRVWFAAASRDERQFPDPETFDLSRNPTSHMAFGRGVHFCISTLLARLGDRVVLNMLFDRFPKLATNADKAPTFFGSAEICGVQTLPLQVQ